jgi:D-sedoheptulose 7-phosphate isomerase
MIKETILEISNNFKELLNSEDSIKNASQILISAIHSGKKILFCGNGGSAADAQHLAAELVGRYRKNRLPIAALALTTDTSIITAVSNDFSFKEIFARQVTALGSEGDVLYAISTSGNSQNVICAVEKAKNKKMKIIGISGSSEGKLDDLCDVLIKVPANRPDRIQEMHIAVGQIICELIENSIT